MKFRPLRDISIQKKLIALVMAISLAALGLTFGVFTSLEIRSERKRALEELSSLGDFIGYNVRASLVFEDEKFAGESLEALRIKKNISVAYLLKEDMSLFAWYMRDQGRSNREERSAETLFSALLKACGEELKRSGHCFSSRSLCLIRPVLLDDEKVGYLVLQADLTEVRKEIARHLNAVLGSLLLSILLTYLLSTRLQSLISRPLDELVQAMDTVSRKEDYGLRIVQNRRDEFGNLTAGFNHMLGQIQSRDRKLEESNRRLEERVNTRTLELTEANEVLHQEVAERIRAERALQESEAKYRLLFENSPISLWEEDFSQVLEHLARLREEGVEDFSDHFARHPEEVIACAEKVQVIDVNLITVEKFRASSKADLLGNLPRVFSEKSFPSFGQILVALAAGETSVEVEGINETLDGEERLFDIRFSLMSTGVESRGKSVVSLVDITERKKAEKALRESEERFRTLVEQAADGFIVHDLKGKILDVNTRMCAMMGYSREELLSMTIRDLDETYDADLYESMWVGMPPGESFTTESLGYRKDGSAIEVEGNIGVVESSGERKILALVRDVTQRKEMERELLSAKARLEHLLTTTPAGIYTARTSGDGVTYFSANVREMLGYEPRQFIEDPTFWADRIHPEDRERIIANLPSGLKAGHHRHEYRFRHVDGTYRWMLDEFRMVRDAEDNPLEIVGYWIDITPLKEAEERLRMSLWEKEVLLQEVHHRVKNNLQLMSSLLNLQLKKAKAPEVFNELSIARNRILSMSAIHDSLYHEADLIRINFSEHVKQFAGRLANLYDVKAEKIALTFDLEEVYLDLSAAIPCSMILNELLTNACKYAFPDGRGGRIIVRLKVEGHHKLLSVEDNGVGILPGFDMQKPDSLGLQIVNSLANQLQGTVSIEQNGGTRITICFKDMPAETAVS